MRVEELISQAADNGIIFERQGERLKLHYTKGRPHPELVERIRERKAEIVRHFRDFWQWLGTPPKQIANDSRGGEKDE